MEMSVASVLHCHVPNRSHAARLPSVACVAPPMQMPPRLPSLCIALHFIEHDLRSCGTATGRCAFAR
jgi:hypothetical protein